MSSITRNLQVYALTRQQSIEVALVYNTRPTNNRDGSFTPEFETTEMQGFMTDLTDKHIDRLREKGITVSKGAMLSLNIELTKAPEEVLYDKLDEYTFNKRSRVIDYSISEGVTVLTLNTETIGYAG